MENKIFISSTFIDLKEHREAVINTIRHLGAIDKSMEYFGARDDRPKDECIRVISEESDIFVGIYAHRYGYIPDGEKISIMELEYESATVSGLPRFIYLIDPETPWKPLYIDTNESKLKLDHFKEKLQANHICQFFSNKYELTTQIAADLGRYFSINKIKQISLPVKATGLVSEAPDERRELSTEEQDHKDRLGKTYIDSRGIFLAHAITPSKVKGQKLDVFIYLIRGGFEDIPDVDSAEFFLGYYWNDQIFNVKNEGGYIGISTSAYAPFLCTCRINFKDGSKAYLNRYIDFEMERVFR